MGAESRDPETLSRAILTQGVRSMLTSRYSMRLGRTVPTHSSLMPQCLDGMHPRRLARRENGECKVQCNGSGEGEYSGGAIEGIRKVIGIAGPARDRPSQKKAHRSADQD